MKRCSPLVLLRGAGVPSAPWWTAALLYAVGGGVLCAQPAPTPPSNHAARVTASSSAQSGSDGEFLVRLGRSAAHPRIRLRMFDPSLSPAGRGAEPRVGAAETTSALVLSNYVASAFTNSPRLQEAILDLAAGERPAARQKLQALLRQNTNDFEVYGILSVLATEENDAPTLRACHEKLRGAGDQMNADFFLNLAGLARLRRDRLAEREYLDATLMRDPKKLTAWEQLLSLDLRNLQPADAEEHARQVLRLQPRHTLANYIMGSIECDRQHYAQAEAYLRTSLSACRSSEALNDLAWTVSRQGRPSEALPLAREALALDGKNAVAWDTLGVILTALHQAEEAERALRTARTLASDQPEFTLHLAQLLAQIGRGPEARELAEGLVRLPGTGLSPATRSAAQQLLGAPGTSSQ
ncbi:MAG: tetratricopeptide repeat protein [Kiritimatiellaeota bacterium]|nr:tetratricopeptide repeat protein [Kiritimatiellota bacterium]